jgi:hypothetical protein
MRGLLRPVQDTAETLSREVRPCKAPPGGRSDCLVRYPYITRTHPGPVTGRNGIASSVRDQRPPNPARTSVNVEGSGTGGIVAGTFTVRLDAVVKNVLPLESPNDPFTEYEPGCGWQSPHVYRNHSSQGC